jgi:hypothetical protein
LSFDNSFCSCVGGKNVTLAYSINNKQAQGSLDAASSRGFPIVVTLILVIAIVAVAAVIILIKRPKINAKNATISSELRALQ